MMPLALFTLVIIVGAAIPFGIIIGPLVFFSQTLPAFSLLETVGYAALFGGIGGVLISFVLCFVFRPNTGHIDW